MRAKSNLALSLALQTGSGRCTMQGIIWGTGSVVFLDILVKPGPLLMKT